MSDLGVQVMLGAAVEDARGVVRVTDPSTAAPAPAALTPQDLAALEALRPLLERVTATVVGAAELARARFDHERAQEHASEILAANKERRARREHAAEVARAALHVEDAAALKRFSLLEGL